jgi:Rad3-related DNA helicase
MDELGRLLVNVCTAVPAGVVCFLPSYQYEEAGERCRLDRKILLKVHLEDQRHQGIYPTRRSMTRLSSLKLPPIRR